MQGGLLKNENKSGDKNMKRRCNMKKRKVYQEYKEEMIELSLWMLLCILFPLIIIYLIGYSIYLACKSLYRKITGKRKKRKKHVDYGWDIYGDYYADSVFDFPNEYTSQGEIWFVILLTAILTIFAPVFFTLFLIAMIYKTIKVLCR